MLLTRVIHIVPIARAVSSPNAFSATSFCREIIYEIRGTPDGANPPIRYSARSEVIHAAYDSPDRCDSGVVGKSSDVAVQHGLGILPQRRARSARHHPHRLYAAGPARRLAPRQGGS